jgi:hypothetical protein
MNSILLSDEYIWSASAGLFEMVVEALVERVSDVATREQLRGVVDYQIGAVNVADLPAAGRDEVLRVLRGDIVDAVEADPRLTPDQPSRRLAIGHVKVLRLMANDL